MSSENRPSANLEPNWGGWQVHRSAGVPIGMEDWLLDRGSLTNRLVRASDGAFRVRVVHQGWGRPLYSESQLLQTRRAETALVREVELLGHGTPWVFARTLIPASSLRGSARRLANLGEKPLGAVLFSDSSMRRGPIQVARLQPRHPLFAAATSHLEQKPAELWGRRTLFYLAGKPLLVNEIFLPDIPLVVKEPKL
ncbi:chorismate--pyruvate lyase family protein [Pseudomonadota bacterium]